MNFGFDLSVKIAGAAGLGIKVAGLVFSKSAVRQGLEVIDYTEYPSLIRGGHNVFFARVADVEIHAHRRDLDILVALNEESANLHHDELGPKGIMIYDPEAFELKASVPKEKLCPVPMKRILAEAGGSMIMLNTLALGALMAVAGLNVEPLLQVLAASFANKAPEVAALNQQVARAGFDYASSACQPLNPRFRSKKDDRIIMEGNEAIALGAIQAGCKFYAAYPMTPASSILHFMAEHDEEYGIVVKHAEDEISVINMAIGASFAGARSMLATSGGGFSLMVEALGLAGISETPIVAVEGQRAGPATGLPTWHEQGDALFVLHAAQGEFPRVVLTPGDNEECFELTRRAFNIAEGLQTPVIILVDQYLCESHQTNPMFNLDGPAIDRGKLLTNEQARNQKNYLRYQITDDGVSWRAIPGQPNCRHIANSYEHDEYGYAEESATNRKAMTEKRMGKLDLAQALTPKPVRFGSKIPKVGIVSWGSNKRPILQALKDLPTDISVGFLHLPCLNPFPVDDVKRFIEECDYPLVIECNYTGQLNRLIKMHGQVVEGAVLHKYDGRPFFPDEIVKKVEEVSRDGIYA